MARVKEVQLGRAHQMAICRFARKRLMRRPGGMGGIVLADGVGLGKTYEALATVATILTQRQHHRERRRNQPYRVLVLVPPGLVSKWADELLLPDRFSKYLKGWRHPTQKAVAATFRDEVVVLRRQSDLRNTRGEHRYGRTELPEGLYIVNHNLVDKPGNKRVTQIHRTRWDAIIIDEAHHIAAGLLDLSPHSLLANPKTATLLLTATPFQLSPQDLKGLLSATFGGYGRSRNYKKATQEAKKFYYSEDFRAYRSSVNQYFKHADVSSAREAAGLRVVVRKTLLDRIVRNRKSENRRYHVVSAVGSPRFIGSNPFTLNEKQLSELLCGDGLINLPQETQRAYVNARDAVCEAARRRKPTFAATALRQLLSTWQQFRQSRFGRQIGFTPPSTPHAKLEATAHLVSTILRDEVVGAPERGWVGKVLVFTTYVGADAGSDAPSDEKAHGTAATLKRELERRLRGTYKRSPKRLRQQIREALLRVVSKNVDGLAPTERSRLRGRLRVFSGSAPAAALLAFPRNLKRECRELGRLLRAVESPASFADHPDATNEEIRRRLEERRERRFLQILHRYSTRDLVARYDGATSHDARDRHLHGFNSPYAPLVLIASSIGQEGIDLQRYCRHVLHYDLEWNPAKLEQREGRVDRAGRQADGPINVYFLLCRGTYDERMLHVMVNRSRWHQVLLANRSALETLPGAKRETYAAPDMIRRIALDLRPPR